MSREVMVTDLVKAQARSLKMPGLARSFETLGRQAREERWSFEDFLHEVLSTEQASRMDSAIRSRLRDARFPEEKTLGNFDFAASDGLDATLFAELTRCEWVKKASNVLLVGPIGTGKTHLAIALGIEAARKRQKEVPRRLLARGRPGANAARGARQARARPTRAAPDASRSAHPR